MNNWESGIRVGPRLVISTLHMHSWINRPSSQECDLLIQNKSTHLVDNETSLELTSEEGSSHFELIGYNVASDLGIFRLKDGFQPHPEWIDIDNLMEEDEVDTLISPGQMVGCVGFNGPVAPEDHHLVQFYLKAALSNNMWSEWSKTASPY